MLSHQISLLLDFQTLRLLYRETFGTFPEATQSSTWLWNVLRNFIILKNKEAYIISKLLLAHSSTFIRTFRLLRVHSSLFRLFMQFGRTAKKTPPQFPLILLTYLLRGFSPQANYTDQAAAACRRS
jgi:hypothetical protein